MTDELEYLRGQLAAAEKAYTLAHEFAAKTQEHADQMLTWSLGLMGAGLYTSYGLLGAAPPAARLWALAPWLAGVLCALGGRVLLARVLNYGALGAHAKISKILLLSVETDVPLVKRNWKELVENAALFAGEKKSSELQPWALRFYTVTHLLFAIGVVAVAAALAIYGPTK
jgi:membrane glycosyltransferase